MGKRCVKLHIVGRKRKLKWSQQNNVRSMREMLLHIKEHGKAEVDIGRVCLMDNKCCNKKVSQRN